MKNLYSIGEVAKIKNLTIKSLRYYHEVGILIPAYIDKLTGYRYYSPEQFIHIDIIKVSRNIGTSIKELQELFKNADSTKLQAFLDSKLRQAKENFCTIYESIDCMDNLNDALQTSKFAVENDNIAIKFINTRYIITFPCKQAGDFKELIYYSKLEKVIEERKIKATFESGILYDVNMNSKLNSIPQYTFKVIDKNYFDKSDDNFAILPNELSIRHILRNISRTLSSNFLFLINFSTLHVSLINFLIL